MADTHVWEEGPVNCKVSLVGLGAKPTCVFKFYKADGSAAGEAKANISGGFGSCAWPSPKVEGDDLSMKMTWKAEVNGAPKPGYEGDIHVWAKQLTVTTEEDGTGKVMPRTDLAIKHAGKLLSRSADEQGTFVFDLMKPEAVEVDVRAPYLQKSVDKPHGKARKLKVEKRFKVKLVFPVPGSDGTHQQWVNLDSDPSHPEQGPKIKIKVAPAVPAEAKAGDKVYLKAEYGAENSERTIDTDGHAKGSSLEEEKTLSAGLEAEWELVVGQAGGDVVTITAGGTPARTDAKVKVVTWRKLFYEFVAPQSMNAKLEAKILPATGKAGKDLGASITDWFRPRLAKAFVQYDCKKSHVFPVASAPAGTLYDNTYFGLATAGKQYVVGDHNAYTLPAGVTLDAAEDRTLQIMAVDRNYFSDDPAVQVDLLMDGVTIDYDVPAGIFAFAISMQDGSASVQRVWWTAEVDPVAMPAHPGVAAGAARVEFGDANWVTFVNYKKLRITLPSGVGQPGAIVGALSATKCPVTLSFEIIWSSAANGMASGGKQVLVLNRPPKAAACTLCHELGHSMGMTVMDPTAATPYGEKPPYGLAYPPTVPGGDVYVGHGHSGTHCANGLADKTLASFSGIQGTCIMYGSGNDDPTPARDQYCATCLKYLKARKLTDVRSGFKTRADEEC